ncbi:hypothetical protein Q5P01_017817 [Channa striata]|uniref:Uncharacterized protein n=1 Tax=Channa striata TaxID=64152 RepID=A0AA88MAZ2_CHASR|nr:hypothetical protein Q5P01_017817 [Channa striata]
MGHEMSAEQKKEIQQKELDNFVKTLKEAPDLRVNKNIVMFCSLSSSDNLKQHYEQRKMEAGDCAADWIKSLMEKLGELTPAPALAGLGGLAIAVLIDIISFNPPEECIKEALRTVFAEEKASEVWDQIDECLKRCTMNINNKDKLKSDIERIESQLSTALTKLRNSMVRDGQMSSQALKAWVNGAAFHIQMLIHLVRLGGTETCDPVKNLLSVYEKDLDKLFEKHREVIESKCQRIVRNTQAFSLVYLVDEESTWNRLNGTLTLYDQYLEAYYNHRRKHSGALEFLARKSERRLGVSAWSSVVISPGKQCSIEKSTTNKKMGNSISESQQKEREREQQRLHDFPSETGKGPDLTVNKNIVMFCSLSSSDNLKQHYEQRKMEAGDCAADWIKSLTEKLGDLTPAPALAGLVTLAIAVFIDIISFSPPEEGIREALRTVFAEEKASEVWDQIDECLKRCTMHINDHMELKSDIRRIESQLSTALTKLRNSMVRDGQMSSQALKAWVNGAAFHIQMLIHLVRLGGTETCDPVKNLLSVYEKDLDKLFEKHREVIESKCKMKVVVSELIDFFYLVGEDSKRHYIGDRCSYFEKYVEAYYNHRFLRQKPEIQQHFRDVRENLQSLVRQTGSFKP